MFTFPFGKSAQTVYASWRKPTHLTHSPSKALPTDESCIRIVTEESKSQPLPSAEYWYKHFHTGISQLWHKRINNACIKHFYIYILSNCMSETTSFTHEHTCKHEDIHPVAPTCTQGRSFLDWCRGKNAVVLFCFPAMIQGCVCSNSLWPRTMKGSVREKPL